MIWMIAFCTLLAFLAGYFVRGTNEHLISRSNYKKLMNDRVRLRDALATADAIGDESTAEALRQALIYSYQNEAKPVQP
jgi:hypothetical protein